MVTQDIHSEWSPRQTRSPEYREGLDSVTSIKDVKGKMYVKGIHLMEISGGMWDVLSCDPRTEHHHNPLPVATEGWPYIGLHQSALEQD